MISVIVPCYNEEAALPYFLAEIQAEADRLTAAYGQPFEFLFINDGSCDKTLDLLRK